MASFALAVLGILCTFMLTHVGLCDPLRVDAHAAAIPAAPPPQPPAVPPARIALLHMYDGVHFFRRLGALTGANKARYAKRHGYDMVIRGPGKLQGLFKTADNCPPGQATSCWMDDNDFTIDAARAPTFGKIKLAIAACKNRPNVWLMWSDADALIVNQTVPLESLIDDGYDIILSYDWLMVQAGVLLFKCTPWTVNFLQRAYDDRSFDSARALDQSAFQAFLDKLTKSELDEHVKTVPKYAMNVYLEEYRPGDFLIHMAGKLYEATEPGLWAIANQFDILSMVEDVEDISAFFGTRHLLNKFSGLCPVGANESQRECKPQDSRRMMLKEPLGAMSTPNRYRHVAMRYYFLQSWTDKYDTTEWLKKRRVLAERGLASADGNSMKVPPVLVPDHAPAKDGLKQDGDSKNAAVDLAANVGHDMAIVEVAHLRSRRPGVKFIFVVMLVLGLAARAYRKRRNVDIKRR
jgi:hypothetical protein